MSRARDGGQGQHDLVELDRCVVSGGPQGTGTVTMTFAHDGTPETLELTAPFRGTPAGGGILGRFRGVRMAPYSGSGKILRRTFVL